jgi:hypothetical protein
VIPCHELSELLSRTPLKIFDLGGQAVLAHGLCE